MILASQSPRRIELMREAGYDIRVIPADIDETPFDGELRLHSSSAWRVPKPLPSRPNMPSPTN